MLGELQKLDDLYSANNSSSLTPSSAEPILGDVEHFNVDNNIVREQVMAKIREEREEQERNRELMSTKEEKQVYYYYKRWIWV